MGRREACVVHGGSRVAQRRTRTRAEWTQPIIIIIDDDDDGDHESDDDRDSDNGSAKDDDDDDDVAVPIIVDRRRGVGTRSHENSAAEQGVQFMERERGYAIPTHPQK